MMLMNQLGEILCRGGDTAWEQIEEALRLQRTALQGMPAGMPRGPSPGCPPVKPLGRILVEGRVIGPGALERALHEQSTVRESWRVVDPRRVGRLLESAAALASVRDPVEALHHTLAGAQRLTGADTAVVVLLGPAPGASGRPDAAPGASSRAPLALAGAILLGPAGEQALEDGVVQRDGVLQWVLRRGRAALVEEARNDPRCPGDAPWLYGSEARSVLCVPMQSASGRIGALEVINRSDGIPFTEADGFLLDALADLAALTVRSTRTFRELASRLKDLRAARVRLERSAGEAMHRR